VEKNCFPHVNEEQPFTKLQKNSLISE